MCKVHLCELFKQYCSIPISSNLYRAYKKVSLILVLLVCSLKFSLNRIWNKLKLLASSEVDSHPSSLTSRTWPSSHFLNSPQSQPQPQSPSLKGTVVIQSCAYYCIHMALGGFTEKKLALTSSVIILTILKHTPIDIWSTPLMTYIAL